MSRARCICTVRNARGVHCRVAACLAELVRDHRVRAGITAGGQHADLGSIVEVLSLGIARGTEVVLTVEGKKSADVLARIKQVLEGRKES